MHLNTFVDVNSLHAQVPAFSRQIISEIKKPSSAKRLNTLATSKLKQLSQQTYDSAGEATQPVLDSILRKYNVTDTETFEKQSDSTVASLNYQIYRYTYALLSSIIIIFITWWFLRNKHDLHPTLYTMSVLLAVILLLVGISTSMIEIDARIKSLEFRMIAI